MWSLQTFDSLESNMKQVLVSSVAELFVDAATGSLNIVCEHNNQNNQGEPLPPVLPHELSSIHMRQLSNTVQQHHARLLPVFGQDGIEQICNEFRFFLRAFREEMVFQEAMKAGKEGKKLQDLSDA